MESSPDAGCAAAAGLTVAFTPYRRERLVLIGSTICNAAAGCGATRFVFVIAMHHRRVTQGWNQNAHLVLSYFSSWSRRSCEIRSNNSIRFVAGPDWVETNVEHTSKEFIDLNWKRTVEENGNALCHHVLTVAQYVDLCGSFVTPLWRHRWFTEIKWDIIKQDFA